MKKFSLFLATFLVFAINPLNSFSHSEEHKITIKDHKFNPQNLEVSTHKKIKLFVENQDKTPEEFESFDLNREKIIGGGKTAIIFIGPLKPGTYKYFGEFNMNTAQGTITAK